jgi:hypothetical protein
MLHDNFLLFQRVEWELYLVLINHTIQQDCPLNNTRIAAQQPQLPLSEVLPGKRDYFSFAKTSGRKSGITLEVSSEGKLY